MRDSEARVANRRGGILETRPRFLQTDGIGFHACPRLHDCALEGLEREATRAQAQLLCPSDERPGEGDKQKCERSPVELFAINRRTAGDTQYSGHDGERGDETEGYIDPPRYRYQVIVPIWHSRSRVRNACGVSVRRRDYDYEAGRATGATGESGAFVAVIGQEHGSQAFRRLAGAASSPQVSTR
jgi:hypothetical protein